MALKTNAILKFTDYSILETGIKLNFTCADPGAGQPSDYSIELSDADLSAVSNINQLRALVITKFQRKLRSAGIASKLDILIGQEVVI